MAMLRYANSAERCAAIFCRLSNISPQPCSVFAFVCFARRHSHVLPDARCRAVEARLRCRATRTAAQRCCAGRRCRHAWRHAPLPPVSPLQMFADARLLSAAALARRSVSGAAMRSRLLFHAGALRQALKMLHARKAPCRLYTPRWCAITTPPRHDTCSYAPPPYAAHCFATFT